MSSLLRNLLASWKSSAAGRPASRSRRPVSLQLGDLEPRLAPAAAMGPLTMMPGAPSAPRPTAHAGSATDITISWPSVSWPPGPFNEGYKLYRDGNLIASLHDYDHVYEDSNLTPSTRYAYLLVAYSEGYTSQGSATATTLPNPPVLTVAPGTDGAYGHPDISWTNMSAASPGTHYELAFSNLSLPKIPPAIIFRGIQNSTHVGTQLPQGIYSVRVTAILGTAATAPRVASKAVEFQVGIQASFQGGVLTITGTTAADQIFVGQSNGEISIQGLTHGFGTAPAAVQILDHLPVDGDVYLSDISADLVTTRIIVSGGAGDDQILLNQGDEPVLNQVVIDGGAGDDFVAPPRAPAGAPVITSGEFDANTWAPHETFDGPGIGVRTFTPIEDIYQKSGSNCFFLAPLGEVAYHGADLKDRITYLGNDGKIADAYSYIVPLFRSGRTVNVRVDFSGAVAATDPQPYYNYPTATPSIPGVLQFWTVLYSRAYDKLIGSEIGQNNFGLVPAAMTALTTLDTNHWMIQPNPTGAPNPYNSQLFTYIQYELDVGGNAVIGTYPNPPTPVLARPPESPKLILEHGYSVIALNQDPTTHQPTTVVLRNPWGVDVIGGGAGKTPSDDPLDGIVTLTWLEFQSFVNFIYLSGPVTSATITTPKVATLSAGGPDSFTIGTTGYPAPTFSLGAKDKLPDGVTFDTATGALSGNPAPGSVGTYTLHITADNTVGKSTQTLTLTVTPFTLTLSPPAPTEGDRPVNVLVGTFTDANPAAVVSQYTATVKWGDGQSSSTAGKNVTIVADPAHAGVFDIMATKPSLYSKAGQNLPFSVTVSAPHAPSNTETVNITVTDPPLTLTPVVPAFTVGKTVTRVLVGTFVDDFTGSHAADYTANVFWGDGQSSSSAAKNIVIAADPKQKGVFDIFATKPNPYSAQSGNMILTVTVMDNGGAADSATSPITITTPPPVAKPLVLSAEPNFAAITNAQNGANGFSIAVTYDQPMNPAVKPVITFSPSTAKTLKLASGSWDAAHKVYTAVYNVTVADVTLAAVQATISGAKSATNIVQTSFVRAGLFSINTTTAAVAPTVVSATPAIGTITNAQGGIGGFNIAVTYDQTMNTLVAPVITFSRVIGATLTPASGSWDATGKIYTAFYNVGLANVTDNSVQVTIAGAMNAANVSQTSFTRSGLFAIGTTAATVPAPTAPSVLSATPSIATITNAQGGAGGFSIAVAYNQTMDTAFTPLITFSPSVSSTLTFASGSWNSGHTTYTAVYNVALANVTDNAVQVTISGGKNIADLPQTSFVQNGAFAINTTVAALAPAVVSVTPSIATITNAQGGASGFSIAVAYNQTMDTAFTPSITFSPDVSSTLAFASGSWNSGHTTYTAVYNVALAAVTDNAVQVTVSGAKDAAEVSQTVFSQNGVFAINTTAVVSATPTVVSVTPGVATITNAQVGLYSFKITVTYDQPMDSNTTPLVSFSPDVSSTLSRAYGTWNFNNTAYITYYNVADTVVNVGAVQATVSGARSAAENLQAPFVENSLFAINMTASSAAPSVNAPAPSAGAVTNAQAGANGFSIQVPYVWVMDPAVKPVIAFSPDVSSVLTFASGSWDAGHTVYTAYYNVTLATVTDNAVQVTISGARSAGGVLQTPFVQNGMFAVNTTEPPPNISVTANDMELNQLGKYFGESFVPTVSGPLTKLNVLNITRLRDNNSVIISSENATLKIYQGGINTTSGPDYDTPAGTLLYSQNITFSVGNNSIVLATPPSLAAGQTYLWQVVPENETGLVSALGATNNPYADGDTMVGPGRGYDLNFQVYV